MRTHKGKIVDDEIYSEIWHESMITTTKQLYSLFKAHGKFKGNEAFNEVAEYMKRKFPTMIKPIL